MNTYDAVYVRQSVDKIDSISVESQAEFCMKEVENGNYRIFSDKGYSGKNTDRPSFKELICDIEAGKVRRVIVYRLDRISRSVLDFANLIDIFQKHNVGFVSTMEKFDTGTPIGKAMLMIIMIFAQLERETIQQRVTDAYESRSRRGLFMGGRTPFGFSLKDTVVNGIRTKMYSSADPEADIVRQIYSMYAEPQTSLGDIMRYLDSKEIHKRDGKPFSRSRLRDLIINPVYVRADCQIYDFFISQGADIANPPENFIGVHGAYLYKGVNDIRKTLSLEGHTLVLAPHEGIIDADTWIRCRLKCLNNQASAKPSKAKSTWLAGKIKCACCGYALVTKTYHCKTKDDNRYFLCSHKSNTGGCQFSSVDADLVEKIVFDELVKKLAGFETLSDQKPEKLNPTSIKMKERISEIENEINSLIEKIPSANSKVMEYINERIASLDNEKKELHTQMARFDDTGSSSGKSIKNYMNHWDELSIGDKIAAADCLIERIHAAKDSVEIRWKI